MGSGKEDEPKGKPEKEDLGNVPNTTVKKEAKRIRVPAKDYRSAIDSVMNTNTVQAFDIVDGKIVPTKIGR
jgi:hypothetical protein